MRVLFTTTGSAGHLGPLVPFAEALRRAGDDVLIATRESSVARARATGFDVWPFPDAPAAERSAAMASARDLPLEEAHAKLLKEVFGGMDARAALPSVLDAATAYRPDVVVYEPSELAGRLAAAQHGLPTVAVSITQYAVEHRREAEMDEALRRLSAEHGLAHPNGATQAHFTLMPLVLEHPDTPGPIGMQRFREPDGPPPAPLHDWWGGANDPLVYVTFGSVAAQRGDIFPALYSQVIDHLAPLPIRALVTIGRDRDPRDLGETPKNVHVERWVPQHTCCRTPAQWSTTAAPARSAPRSRRASRRSCCRCSPTSPTTPNASPRSAPPSRRTRATWPPPSARCSPTLPTRPKPHESPPRSGRCRTLTSPPHS